MPKGWALGIQHARNRGDVLLDRPREGPGAAIVSKWIRVPHGRPLFVVDDVAVDIDDATDAIEPGARVVPRDASRLAVVRRRLARPTTRALAIRASHVTHIH